MKTRIAVATAGATGMAAVLSTGSYYAGVDGFALTITCLMGVALGFALWELWWLAGRTQSLHAELLRLPTQADNTHVDGASPMLRALLRARLDRTALPVPGPIFSPYIIGLLVMLGLLGTFLGLFETLRGASTALTTSADVESLRAGLKLPMQGLMRSFGTSATGVATSAMLGLASVFIRRASRELGIALHEMASGPLSRFSPAHRQLVALEALSAQGEAWPKAAGALREATDKLDALRSTFEDSLKEQDARSAKRQVETAENLVKQLGKTTAGIEQLGQRNEKAISNLSKSWTKAHADAMTATSTVLKSTLDDVSKSVDKGVVQAAERASETLSPLIAKAVEGTVDAATQHLDSVLAAVHADASERRETQETATDALQARVTALLKALGTLEDERRTADQAQLSRFESQTGALLSAVADEAKESRSQSNGHAQELFAHVQETLSQLENFTSDAVAREKTRAEATAGMATAITQDLANATTLVRDRLAHSAEAERTQNERSEALFTSLESAASTIGEVAKNQVSSLQSFVERTDERIRDAEGQAQVRLETFVASLHQTAEAQQSRLADFEAALREAQAETAIGFGKATGEIQAQSGRAVEAQQARLGEFEAALRSAQAETAASFGEVAASIQTQNSQAAEKQQTRLAEFEATLGAARVKTATEFSQIANQMQAQISENSGQLSQQLSEVTARLLEAETHLIARHANFSEQLDARSDTQQLQLVQIQEALLDQQNKHAETLGEVFGEQMAALEEQLSSSTSLVAEAADLVKGGGAELITVAETFGAAVEQQRAAAAQWLESLGDLERSVTDAGEAAAADVLGQHLARTHEVFDRQLRFQQELIEQLRTNRHREELPRPGASTGDVPSGVVPSGVVPSGDVPSGDVPNELIAEGALAQDQAAEEQAPDATA